MRVWRDGHHVSPSAIDLAFRCKPPLPLVLITDAVGALGLAEGDYEMVGLACVVDGGTVRLKGSRQLAGSCLTLDQAVRNIHRWKPPIPIADVVHSASWAPALTAGMAHVRGTVGSGNDADIVLLDRDLQVAQTFRAGVSIWHRS